MNGPVQEMKGPAEAGPDHQPETAAKSMTRQPTVDLSFNFLLRLSVTFLDTARKLTAFATDDIKVVVGEFSPLLLDSAFELLPVAFNPIPIHGGLLVV